MGTFAVVLLFFCIGVLYFWLYGIPSSWRLEKDEEKTTITSREKDVTAICALCKDNCAEKCSCGTAVHQVCMNELTIGLCPTCNVVDTYVECKHDWEILYTQKSDHAIIPEYMKELLPVDYSNYFMIKSHKEGKILVGKLSGVKLRIRTSNKNSAVDKICLGCGIRKLEYTTKVINALEYAAGEFIRKEKEKKCRRIRKEKALRLLRLQKQ